MDCHKVMYKPLRTTTPYQNYIKKKFQKEITAKKQYIYDQILKFRQSRYPIDFLQQLQEQINPFQLSLEKLKEVFTKKYPQYSNQLVNQSVEHIFNRKCQESEMVKESAMIIQYGDQYIRNGRKLLKEDFTFNFSNLTARTPQNTSRDRDNKKMQGKTEIQNLNKQNQIKTDRLSTDRNLLTDRNRSLTESPSKIMEMMKKTERFNQILEQELKKQRFRYQNLEDIEQRSNQDSIYYYQNGQTDRSKYNDELPSFNQADLLVQPDFMQTGRSQIEQLNFLLASVNINQQGQKTGRSKRSTQGLKIHMQIRQSLYTVRGNLKINVVKRAIQRLKKQQAEGRT